MHISHLLRPISLLALLSAVFFAVARPVDPTLPSGSKVAVDTTAAIRFPQGDAAIDLSFDGNRTRLDSIIRQLKRLTGPDSTYVISALRVIGSSSPDGTAEINRLFSEQRAHTLLDYVASHATLPDSIIDFEYLGRNWRGLYNLVLADNNVPDRDKVLALLKRATANPNLSAAESNRLLADLKALNWGVPYYYMYLHLFPALRFSYLTLEYEKRIHREIGNLVVRTIEADEKLRNDSLQSEKALQEEAVAEEVTAEEPVREEAVDGQEELLTETSVRKESVAKKTPGEKRNFYMDIRTNMLFDIAAVPNLGAEFYLGKDFSILGNWMYGWWRNDERHRYWRLYGGELTGRWWFGRKAHAKPLTGHHLGIYCGALIFDFEWGGTGYMGGKPGAPLWERTLVNTGFEYGYSLPIGRHLNIDFSIGLGYLGGNYIKYFPFDNDYYREKEYKMRFFGPTKAEISLVWLLGRGNTNPRKGGGR